MQKVTHPPSIWDVIARVKEQMKTDPALAVSFLRGRAEVKDARLDDLVWSLSSGRWGCHVNDVKGVLEWLEGYLTTAASGPDSADSREEETPDG